MKRLTEKTAMENEYLTSDFLIAMLGIDKDNQDKDTIIANQAKIINTLDNKLGKYEDLEEQLGCPLDLVLIPYFISGLKKVWYHNQWCDVVRVVAYEEATTPYMEVRCKDYDYLKFIPLTNYKKTFWLKEDKSE